MFKTNNGVKKNIPWNQPDKESTEKGQKSSQQLSWQSQPKNELPICCRSLNKEEE